MTGVDMIIQNKIYASSDFPNSITYNYEHNV